jgi:transcriptional regulator with PAS, ATPase and Fis domain
MSNLQDYISEILKNAIDSMYCTVITDEKANIVYLSKSYRHLLGVSNDFALGKPITDIIPNSRIPHVLRSGTETIGDIFQLKNGMLSVCNKVFIRDEHDKIIGVLSNATIGLDQVDELNNRIKKLEAENTRYKREVQKLKMSKYSIESIISTSDTMKNIKTVITKIANSPISVLITGETGTGKELFANAIHMLSGRADSKYVKINCAAIPKELLESELFGYEDGAFSGALKGGKIGKFELANNGTILLDEIGEMPMALQSKLLRVLQEQEIERVGSLKPIKLNVRVICATNQNIEEQVKSGKFREDLYYRINVMELKIPPLRDRLVDIPELCSYFIDKINESHGLGISDISTEAMSLFYRYTWPGNVRELEHVLERACFLKGSGQLEASDFDFLLSKILKDGAPELPENLETTLEDVKSKAEKERIINALFEVKGSKTKAAALLGINRSVLYGKLKKYEIDL